MDNPYSAPAADLTQPGDHAATYAPVFASLHGRIGRARYVAYTILPWLLMMAATRIVDAIAPNSPLTNLWLPMLINIPAFGLLFVMSIRRLNDMNLSGWISLLGLIPVINLLLWVGLMAAPGTEGPNRHGPAPGKNTTGVIAAAWVGPVLLLLAVGAIMFAVLRGFGRQ